MSWPIVALGELCRPKQWKTISKKQMLPEGVPVYGANGQIGYTDRITHDVDTILIGCRGSCGTLHIMPGGAYANGNAMALDELRNELVDLRYLFRYLERRGFKDVITGSSQPQIIGANLRRIEISLPPLDEQKRIAAILDKADALRQTRRRAITRLDDLAQSIFYEMFGDPASNSKCWEVSPIGELAEGVVPGRTKPKSFSGPTPWITTKELVRNGVTVANDTTPGLTAEEIRQVGARVIPGGSVVMTCVGDLGVSSLLGQQSVINQQLHAFKCEEPAFATFLMFALPFQKRWMLQRATQTTLPYMNKSTCNGIPMIVPPMEVCETFHVAWQDIQRVRAEAIGACNNYDRLFASLQQRAFCGEL